MVSQMGSLQGESKNLREEQKQHGKDFSKLQSKVVWFQVMVGIFWAIGLVVFGYLLPIIIKHFGH